MTKLLLHPTSGKLLRSANYKLFKRIAAECACPCGGPSPPDPADPCEWCQDGKTPSGVLLTIASSPFPINGTWDLLQNGSASPCTFGDGAGGPLQIHADWTAAGTITGFAPFVVTYVIAITQTVSPFTTYNLNKNVFTYPDDCVANYNQSGTLGGGPGTYSFAGYA